MRDFRLTRTNILVRRQEAETQTKGGILLPDSVRPSPLQGTIIGRTGLDCKDGLKAGDTVLFDPFAGVEVVIDSRPYLIMDEKDVMLIFRS